ncbi:phage tail protein [Azotobacter chroococcum]|uniref:Tail tube protein n=1 Tax=Azotobacter chroococcum TaxID=353 RepID=A0A4R1PJ67_9GAMM|nr:phage tail protein [Azotobacter chroococcum]TBV95967.1 phage tail protein [Azotobacter chroococcum]TCL26814.1 tail tube protein [Azotobacter chroococcum]
MGYKLPDGGTFQHAATYGSPIAFSAISNAAEAVATIASGTLAAGDIVLLESAWSALNGRVVRVKAADVTTVTLEDIDTTNTSIYPAGSGAGSMKKVETWVQVPQITGLDFSGDEQQYIDVVFLEDRQGRQVPTERSAALMTLTVADDPSQAYVPVLRAADDGKQVQAARLNLPGNDTIFYGAFTSFSRQPTVARGNVLTRTISLALQAEPTRYSA